MSTGQQPPKPPLTINQQPTRIAFWCSLSLIVGAILGSAVGVITNFFLESREATSKPIKVSAEAANNDQPAFVGELTERIDTIEQRIITLEKLPNIISDYVPELESYIFNAIGSAYVLKGPIRFNHLSSFKAFHDKALKSVPRKKGPRD